VEGTKQQAKQTSKQEIDIIPEMDELQKGCYVNKDGVPLGTSLDETAPHIENDSDTSIDITMIHDGGEKIRLTCQNASDYIGYDIEFKSRGNILVTKIQGVTKTCVKIDHTDLNNCLTLSRKIYVIV
jgi:hypothetical protein